MPAVALDVFGADAEGDSGVQLVTAVAGAGAGREEFVGAGARPYWRMSSSTNWPAVNWVETTTGTPHAVLTSELDGSGPRVAPVVVGDAADRRSQRIVSVANVPKSVPKAIENGPRRDLRGPF